MFKSLDQRFKDFLETLKEVENIDNLTLNKEQQESKKADYFTKNRQLIIELKSLETDTEHKIEKIIAPHRERPEFPHFFGGVETHKILKHLPDGDQINRQLIEAVTSALEEIYRKANKQVRTTKKTFNLPDSQGLLIILNHKIDVLAPEHIVYKLRRILAKKHPDESFQFPEINCILIFSEAHFSPRENQTMAFPIIRLPVGIIGEFHHDDAVDFITRKWTEFNNVPLLEGGAIEKVRDLNLQSVAQNIEANQKLIPRHEAWRRYYRRVRYLKRYNEENLKWFFKIVFTELASGLFVGANKKHRDNINYWGEIFTHFLEEVNIRGLDFRIFKSTLQSIDFGDEKKNEISKIINEEDFTINFENK